MAHVYIHIFFLCISFMIHPYFFWQTLDHLDLSRKSAFPPRGTIGTSNQPHQPNGEPRGSQRENLALYRYIGSKLLILGMVMPPLIGTPFTGYKTLTIGLMTIPYYMGINRSLDPSTYLSQWILTVILTLPSSTITIITTTTTIAITMFSILTTITIIKSQSKAPPPSLSSPSGHSNSTRKLFIDNAHIMHTYTWSPVEKFHPL